MDRTDQRFDDVARVRRGQRGQSLIEHVVEMIVADPADGRGARESDQLSRREDGETEDRVTEKLQPAEAGHPRARRQPAEIRFAESNAEVS